MERSIVQDIKDSPSESTSSPEYVDAVGTAESSDHTEYEDAVSVHGSNSPDRSNDSNAIVVVELKTSAVGDNAIPEETSCSEGDGNDGLSDVVTSEAVLPEKGSTSAATNNNETESNSKKLIKAEDKIKTQSTSTLVKKSSERVSTDADEPSAKKARSAGPSEHGQEDSSGCQIDTLLQKQPESA